MSAVLDIVILDAWIQYTVASDQFLLFNTAVLAEDAMRSFATFLQYSFESLAPEWLNRVMANLAKQNVYPLTFGFPAPGEAYIDTTPLPGPEYNPSVHFDDRVSSTTDLARLYVWPRSNDRVIVELATNPALFVSNPGGRTASNFYRSPTQTATGYLTGLTLGPRYQLTYDVPTAVLVELVRANPGAETTVYYRAITFDTSEGDASTAATEGAYPSFTVAPYAICNPSFCGNNAVNFCEVCDGGTQACSVSCYSGTKTCLADCSGFSTTCDIGDQYCGNGIDEGWCEECETGSGPDCGLLEDCDDCRCECALFSSAQAAGRETELEPLMDDLRKVRDDLFRGSAIGDVFLDVLAKHSEEINLILEAHPELAAQAADLMVILGDLAQRFFAGDMSAADFFLGKDLQDRLDALLHDIYPLASPELEHDLKHARNEAKALLFKSLKDAVLTLNGNYGKKDTK